jgi:hypothetical protein
MQTTNEFDAKLSELLSQAEMIFERYKRATSEKNGAKGLICFGQLNGLYSAARLLAPEARQTCRLGELVVHTETYD